ncbi:putative ferric-chelate reductase 1 [Dendrobates tinctorius]|uniref:putative ferric-chelate reductase 1 n=1 Tax=Dendrobates tinctorius TaxID=92724 RepID=UPI003CC97DA6
MIDKWPLPELHTCIIYKTVSLLTINSGNLTLDIREQTNSVKDKMNPLFQYMVVALVLFPLQVTAYPNGLVTEACSDMSPQHGYAAQTSSAPYMLTASKTSYKAGDKITVTLKNTSQDYPIEGFLIQARQPNSNTPLGSFQVTGSDIQTLNCTTTASAVSHTSDKAKDIVEVTWIAPNVTFSTIQFRATAVSNLSIFWTNLAGPSLTYSGSGLSHLTKLINSLLLDEPSMIRGRHTTNACFIHGMCCPVGVEYKMPSSLANYILIHVIQHLADIFFTILKQLPKHLKMITSLLQNLPDKQNHYISQSSRFPIGDLNLSMIT